ncbi:MAG: glycosyltransferase family 2 protein [Deltaproteobacteria bacterium]|nr:MAG: glycosyltransferase family 2 protein [Deltaproteobacteria bacterium]
MPITSPTASSPSSNRDSVPASPEISFAIPCYNERDNLVPLIDAIEREADRLGREYEIVITDDRSTDGSWELLLSLAREHPRVRLARLATNSGESAASFAAMRAARGRIIVTLDADLQNDPGDVGRFVAALEHADCVCGTRTQSRREGDSWVKTLVSRCSNWIRSRVLQDPITDAGCTYRALRRECLDEVPFFRGVHRFLPILIALRGFRVVEVAVVNRDRRSGKSHYGVLDRAGAVIDMLAVRWMKTRMAPYQVVERWPRE